MALWQSDTLMDRMFNPNAVSLNLRHGKGSNRFPLPAVLDHHIQRIYAIKRYLLAKPPILYNSFQPKMDLSLEVAVSILGIAASGFALGWGAAKLSSARKRRAPTDSAKSMDLENPLLREIIDTTPDFVFVKDLNLRNLLCNQAYAAAVGKLPQDLKGKSDIESGWDPLLVNGDPEKGVRGYRHDDEAALAGESVHNQADSVRAGESILYFDTIKRPLFDQNGKVYGLLGIAREVTARKRAELVLRENEERFRFLLDAMAEIPIQGYDRERRVVFWNKASERTYGYSRQEALGQRLEDLIIPPAMRAGVVAATKAYFEQRTEIPAGELELRDKQGKPVHVYSSHLLYTNVTGATEMYCVDIDLNQLRRAEAALLKSEHRLQLVLKGSNEGWWDWNLAESEMYYSPRWYEMLGYDYLELPATLDLWREFLHPDDLDRIDSEIHGLINDPKITYSEFEFRMRHRNGHYFPVLCRGYLQRDERGAVVRATGLNLDVSERKQTEAILQAQVQLSALVQRGSLAEIQALALERAKALTGSVSGFFIVLPTGSDGITTSKRALLDRFASECGHGMVHLSGEHIAGKLSGVHPMLPVSEALAYPICRNKHLKALLVVGDKPTPYTNRDSQTLQQLADSIWDAIGHKQAEMERRRNQIALERAKAEAERANRAKSDFLATMSHEIRTPLNGVIGMADYMRFLDLSKEQQECVEIIYESGNLLLGLIEDILDLSKIEAGKLVLHPVEADLSDELDSLVKLMAVRAERAKIILHLEIKLPSGRYCTDVTRLRQILINLIGNALKFTPAGGRIDVSVAQTTPDVVRFAVKDTGIGIAEDSIGFLFQPFSQIQEDPTRKQSGTGLGLSICKRLVHLLGGEIGVVSKPGKGSTFWFTIAARMDKSCSSGEG